MDGRHSVRVDGGGSSSPPPSVLFRSPYIMDPLFVHYLPKPEQALWLGWESQTRLLELKAGEVMWTHRTDPLSLPHFLEAQGYPELLAVFNSQPAVGVDRLGA